MKKQEIPTKQTTKTKCGVYPHRQVYEKVRVDRKGTGFAGGMIGLWACRWGAMFRPAYFFSFEKCQKRITKNNIELSIWSFSKNALKSTAIIEMKKGMG